MNIDEEKELEKTVTEQMTKLQNSSILIGAQTMCKMVLDMIFKFEGSPGKKSTNDYKRCIKEIKDFCNTGLNGSRKKEENN